MKIKTMLLACLMGVVVLFLGREFSSAQPNSGAPSLKIATVSVRAVFLNCKANARYRAGELAEQSKISAAMDLLRKEIQAQEAGLKALRPGSADHLEQYRELFNKQYALEAQQKFNGQQRVLKDRRWTEELYKEILRITKSLAEEKGLDMVFEKDEPEFPVPSPDELMMTLSTHKVLYSGGCVDMTDEVVARLDAEELKFEN
jgi:Skp family chaperone for outer membrane proteins